MFYHLKRILASFRKNRGEVLQWASAAMVLTGVICEFIQDSDIYFVVITLGALFWAVSQKIKHPKVR